MYLVERYEDARRRVSEAGDNLLLAFPTQGEEQDEEEMQDNQGQASIRKAIRERLEENKSNKKQDKAWNIEEQTDIKEKLTDNQKESQTTNHGRKTQDQTKHKQEDGVHWEKEKERERESPECENEVSDGCTRRNGKSGGEGEAEPGTRRAVSKGSQDGEEEDQWKMVLLHRAIRGEDCDL